MSNHDILVTGGAGYIGSHFINKFLQANNDVHVVVVDNFSQTKNNVIKDDRIKYLKVDLLAKKQLEKVFQKNHFDSVVHFAALASVPDSVNNPQRYYENNVVGGLNLLNCMIEKNVKKIVFSSSASVYGEPISEFIDEDHPKIPVNPYGQTKLIFEEILSNYSSAYNLNSISFRYFCAAGCDEAGKLGEFHKPETHAMPSILEALLGFRQEFCIYGDDYDTLDGTGVRDYIHVNDLASAHILALQKLSGNDRLCKSYNLGINRGFSVMELINATEEITGKKLKYQIKKRRPGDPSRLIADSRRAQDELGWKPQYLDIKEIIKTAYSFYQLHKL